MKQTYTIEYDKEMRKDFSEEEKKMLRPIAETLALLDGNAFFTIEIDGKEWYESYLPEAWLVFSRNGGLPGWAGEASWIKEQRKK